MQPLIGTETGSDTRGGSNGAQSADGALNTGPIKFDETSPSDKPPVGGAPSGAVPEVASTPEAEMLKKYGVSVRTNGDQQEFFYRGSGQDNVVLSLPTGATNKQIEEGLEGVLQSRIAEVESKYKVDIASPGEPVEREVKRDAQCFTERGDMIYAQNPTLPALHGIEAGLKVSQPSQFGTDRQTGSKIFILDRKPMPNIYGDKPVLGVYKAPGKGQGQALYITPAGMEKPPTPLDMPPGETRNLAWITAHETTHNSQEIHWGRFPPDDITDKMGWKKFKIDDPKTGETKHEFYFLKAKQGELFTHLPGKCGEPSAWFRVNEQGESFDANSNTTKSMDEAKRYTDQEVMDRALVKPNTYYFMSPKEMLSEALTGLRMGRESRAQLMKDSPALYGAAKEYDQQELNNYYGATRFGGPTHVRTPDGMVVPRTSVSVTAIARFEQSEYVRSLGK